MAQLSTLGVFARMVTKPLHSSARFLMSGLCVLVLVLCMKALAMWSSVDREVRWSFAEGSAAAVAMVILAPVLWRGDQVQRILAAALLILPVIGFSAAILTAVGYLFDFHL